MGSYTAGQLLEMLQALKDYEMDLDVLRITVRPATPGAEPMHVTGSVMVSYNEDGTDGTFELEAI